MRPLKRIRKSATISTSFRGKRRIKRNLDLLNRFLDDQPFDFKSSVWKKAKEQLKRESYNKCAYCEADTTVVAHGDVEHFRPKSIYWWLAYCYDNYLFSCQICNQVYKKNHFPRGGPALEPVLPGPEPDAAALEHIAANLTPDPLKDEEGMPMARFLEETADEEAHLVNPYETDPATLFSWKADKDLEEVVILPVNESPKAKAATAAAENYYGLNREELRKLRWKTYEILETFKLVLDQAEIPESLTQRVREQIRDMTGDHASFSGMARHFVKAWQLGID
jgi:hypothetical protein